MAPDFSATETAENHAVAEALCDVSAEHGWDDDEMTAVMAIAEGLLRNGSNTAAVAAVAAGLWEGLKQLYPLTIARHSGSPGADFMAMAELAGTYRTRGYPFDWNILEVHETLVAHQKPTAEAHTPRSEEGVSPSTRTSRTATIRSWFSRK